MKNVYIIYYSLLALIIGVQTTNVIWQRSSIVNYGKEIQQLNKQVTAADLQIEKLQVSLAQANAIQPLVTNNTSNFVAMKSPLVIQSPSALALR